MWKLSPPRVKFWSGWCAVGVSGGNTQIDQARIGFIAGKLRPIFLSRLQNWNSGWGRILRPGIVWLLLNPGWTLIVRQLDTSLGLDAP